MDEITKTIKRFKEIMTGVAAVVVVVNEKENTVKVYGLNISEDDVPTLLLEAASQVCGSQMHDLNNRVLQ